MTATIHPQRAGKTDADDESANDNATSTTIHLDSIPDGYGCVEIWEHMSERRGDGAPG